MQIAERSETFATNGYRYGFNGKEQDNEVSGEGNSYDFGARIYDSRLGRWMSTDPLSGKYPFASPYSFVLNTPIQAIDPDGQKVVFKSEKEANEVAADVSRIYKAKYGVENAVTVKRRVTKVQVLVNPVVLSDPSTWIRVFEKDKYKEVEKVDYELVSNNDMDWTTDKYTSSLFDVLNSDVIIQGDIIGDNQKGASYGGFLQAYGGGLITSSKSFILSDKLSKYGDEGTVGKFASKWTLGAVFLHEVSYHLDDLGQAEQNITTNVGDGPNIMRRHYNSKTGKNHGAGSKNSIKETEKLKSDKNKTKKKE
jgi:RHS repeat-associated protein